MTEKLRQSKPSNTKNANAEEMEFASVDLDLIMAMGYVIYGVCQRLMIRSRCPL